MRFDKHKPQTNLQRMISNLSFKTPLPEKEHVFRHEFKYILNRYEFQKALNICKKYMPHDPYCGKEGKYFISSLYFDGVNDNDYFDKVLGSLDRKKMRIRAYGYEYNWANLEMKRKIDIWEYKDKVMLDRDQVTQITEGDFQSLLDIGTDEAKRFYVTLSEGVYRPRAVIEYERTAFMLPFEDVRITFDENVRYSVSSFDLFSEKTMTPAFSDGQIVFEIKYNEYLPKWAKRMLSKARLTTEAVSKYEMARINFI